MSKIVKSFEILVNKTLFNINKILYNPNKKIKNKLLVSNLNKFIISFISLLFIYLFYLSIPNLYNKLWLQNAIEDKLLEEFKINFSISSEFSYNILPSPHFLIKNTKIFRHDDNNADSLAEVKKLKIFISQKNFFNKEKIYITNVLINNANFSLKREDFNLLEKISIRKLSDKSIEVTNSNIFLKDNSNNVLAIIKVKKALLFYNNLKLLNVLDLAGEVFNLPFSLTLNDKIVPIRKREINMVSKKLKLKIFNESIKNSDNLITGLNSVSTLNSKFLTLYRIAKKKIIFKSRDSRIKNSTIDYKGTISLRPFDLNLDISLEKMKLSKVFNADSFFFELLKTQLFFNENISAKISLDTKFFKNKKIFDSAKINFNLINGNINFNQTKLINNKIGSLKLVNSILFLDNKNFFLNSNVEIDIKNSDKLFLFLQTPKKVRNSIKKIYFNLDYNFLADEISINNFYIDDGENNTEMVKIINNFYNNNKNKNINTSRRMLNKIFSFYKG